MTEWIATNEIGWHNNSIGFNSIMGCFGVALQTANWLAGWHIGGDGRGGNPDGTGGKITREKAAFLQYIQNIAPNGWPVAGMPIGNVRLWGAFNRGENHAGNGWRQELEEIAAHIGFTGKVYGYDLKSKIGHTGCDVVFTRNGNGCTVEYKRSGKMIHAHRALPLVTPVRALVPRPLGIQIEAIHQGAGTQNAHVVGTPSNKGQMHRASTFSLMQFTIP